MTETSVLIVGGGPAGLVAAGLLAISGVKCILLEKHEKPSLHPRAVGFTTRTMEIFDALGVVDKVPQITEDFRLRRIQVESLAGKWGDELGPPGGQAGGHAGGQKGSQPTITDFSPYLGAAIAQDKLDAILRQRTHELNCDTRFGHKMLDFSMPENLDGPIHVRVRDPSGKEYTLSARYLLGADGHKSQIRESLNIKMSGRGHISTLQSVLFRAPSLNKYLERGFQQFQIKQPENNLQGFLTTYGDGRWVLMGQDERIRSEQGLREAILNATGIPDLEYEFVTTGMWDLSARIAESFSFPANGKQPRVFLLGDSGHTLPPTRGGYGANTGISDAHNIAWKLALVLSGQSNTGLLRSYDAERRPVAWLRHQQIFAGPDYARYRREGEDYGSLKDPIAMELGQTYHSDIIVQDSGPDSIRNNEPVALRPDQLKGLPGSRAPHVWLSRDKKKISSLHIFENKWSIVTCNSEWVPSVEQVSKALGLDILVVCPGLNNIEEDTAETVLDKFGLSHGSASLVRPDGFISWRSKGWKDSTTATSELVVALKRSACIP